MPARQLIDAHCHLDFPAFDEDRSDVLQRAKENHITDIIIPGTEKIYWDRIKSLCSENPPEYPFLHACYGLHPYWISGHNRQDLKTLRDYVETDRPAALGECGLDFRPQYADKKAQLYFFEAQLDLAADSQLPVVIHAVRSTEAVIQTIRKYKMLKGMVHSYSGSAEQAKQLIDLNFYISLGGSVTYDNASKIKKVAMEIPLSSLLLETDAPDQPDQKNKGRRNEPSFLTNTLEAVSALREEPPEVIASQTTANTKALFDI